MRSKNRRLRVKPHVHHQKNSNEDCYMCKRSLNRKAKLVQVNMGFKVMVCPTCKELIDNPVKV